jgi:type I restriction enzyme S subunit
MLSKAAKSGGTEHPYLGNADVRWGRLQLSGLRTMSFSDAERQEFDLKAGDVLICEGGEVGRCTVVDRDLPGVYFQKALHRVRCSDRLDPQFLYRYMRFAAATGRLDDYSSQATIKHLTGVKLRTLPIPLPPLEEQRRIAAILDKADDLRAKRRAVLDKLESLTQAIILDMFGDPIRGSNDRPRITLGEVAEIVGGGTPSRARPEFFQGSTCWATSKDMKASVLRDTEEHITPEAIAASATKLVPAGAVLVVVKSKVLAHRLPVAVAAVETCFGQDLKAVLPNDRWQSSFLAESIRAAAPWLLRQARGVNTEGLTLEHLRSAPLWDATTTEQAEFERRRQAVVRASSAGVASAAEVDSLFASIQSRAFRGEL